MKKYIPKVKPKFKTAKSELVDLGVRPTKERGQNFLIDPNVIESIYAFGAPATDMEVIEIGPGLGALTAKLAHYPKLTLIELESKFCEKLKNDYPNVKIINQDVRTVDFSELGENLFVFGNLPYVYSTDILFHLIKYSAHIDTAVLLLQKEFSERVGSPPDSKAYGSLSVATQINADVTLGEIIPGDRFHPPTKVSSRLLKLKFHKTDKFGIEDKEWFTRVVRASFVQRRKKLPNSLKASGFFNAAMIAQALEGSGIDSGRRAETLSIPEFIKLADALKEAGK